MGKKRKAAKKRGAVVDLEAEGQESDDSLQLGSRSLILMESRPAMGQPSNVDVEGFNDEILPSDEDELEAYHALQSADQYWTRFKSNGVAARQRSLTDDLGDVEAVQPGMTANPDLAVVHDLNDIVRSGQPNSQFGQLAQWIDHPVSTETTFPPNIITAALQEEDSATSTKSDLSFGPPQSEQLADQEDRPHEDSVVTTTASLEARQPVSDSRMTMEEGSLPLLVSGSVRHHELSPEDQHTNRQLDTQPTPPTVDVMLLPDTVSIQDEIVFLGNSLEVSNTLIPGNTSRATIPATGTTLPPQEVGSMQDDIAMDDYPGDSPTTPSPGHSFRASTSTRTPQQAASALQTDSAIDDDGAAHSPSTSTPKGSIRIATPTGVITSPQPAVSVFQSDTAMDNDDPAPSPTTSTPKDSIRVATPTRVIASPQPAASGTAMYDDQVQSPTTPTPLPDLPASTPPASPSLSPAPPSPAQVQLQDFISKRTIPRLRNRTAVQLHPYQMERAHYLTVIRQGRRPVEEEMSLAAEKRVRNLAEDYGAEDQSLVPTETTSMSKPTPEPDEDDRLEYFSQFGVDFESDDKAAKERIKVITLERIRIDKEERKRRKEIRRGRKEFEALLRRRDGVESEDGSDQVVPAAKKRRRVDSTDVPSIDYSKTSTPARSKSKTYAGRNRQRPRAASNVAVRDMDALTSRRRSTTAHSKSPLPSSPGQIQDDYGQNDYDIDMVDDPPATAVTTARKVTPSSSSSSSDDTSEGTAFTAKKRIAGRMLPAAMLKRLEAEQVRREERKRERQDRQARAGASASPVRPGKAIIRKSKTRTARDALDDAMGFLVDPDESLSEGEANGLSFYLAEQAKERAKEAPIRIFSDDEDDVLESTSSEAHEDNVVYRQNRLLDAGDFESLVNGAKEPRRPTRISSHQRRRPAIGLVGAAPRTPRAPIIKRPVLHQARLDLERLGSRASKSTKVKSKPRYRQSKPKQPRLPAIYLDDETIYAREDFAFAASASGAEGAVSDSASVFSVRSITPAKNDKATKSRPKERSKAPDTKTRRGTRDAIDNKAKSSKLKPNVAFDADVGKIRSWLNLGPCDPDFGLAPLPKATTFPPDSMLSNGHLENLLASVDGRVVDSKPPEAETAFGFSLEPHASSDNLLQIITPIFDLAFNRVLELANARLSVTEDHLNPVLKVLRFFHDYLTFTRLPLSPACEPERLRQAIYDACLAITTMLEDIPMPRARGDRSLPNFILQIRWGILELLALSACRPGWIAAASEALAAALLDYGVNATMKSVKLATSLSPDAPLLQDFSIDTWVALRHLCDAVDKTLDPSPKTSSFMSAVDFAVTKAVAANPSGPEASERVWYLVFGMCTLAQITPTGAIEEMAAQPMWPIVKKAIGLVTVVNDESIEAAALAAQVQNRDAYIRVMLVRALNLVSTWRWEFVDRETVSTATRSLGLIFKNRNHRDLPSERAVDFPRYITDFDMSLTASLPVDEGSAYDLYLRLVCISASDLLSSATSMEAALQAERDVQRLLQPIFPISPFPFTKEKPPSPRQLSALTNRYSTLVVACYFSPPLLNWLLANAKNWLNFADADFNSRKQSIRGIMYLAVACRHHELDLLPVVERLKSMLDILHHEYHVNRTSSDPAKARNRMVIERTMILAVSAFRQIIQRHTYDPTKQSRPSYPDPLLLDGWAAKILSSDLILDRLYGREIVSTVQCFLDARGSALPVSAAHARAAKGSVGTQDEYPSLGFEFSEGDFAALGDTGPVTEDMHKEQDAALAKLLETVISPSIYQVVSTLLTTTGDLSPTRKPDLQAFLQQLTKCWVDCASVVVVEHSLHDWSTYVGYGKQSWGRLRDDTGRRQVGMTFMLNVAKIDPSAFNSLEEAFIGLLLQSLVVEQSQITIEPEFVTAILNMPGATSHPFLTGLVQPGLGESQEWTLSTASFLEHRLDFLQTIFSNIPTIMRSTSLPQTYKPFVYQSINTIVSLMRQSYQSIAINQPTIRDTYRVFSNTVVADLRRLSGDHIQATSIPDLKHFPLHQH